MRRSVLVKTRSYWNPCENEILLESFMATRSKIPLARLSAITRKRLFRIISGEDHTHPEPRRSTTAECRHFFGIFRSQESENPLINTTIRTFTPSASSSANRSESKRPKLDNVLCHEFSDSGCNIYGEKVHDRMYSESKQGKSSDRECQRVNHTSREENLLPRRRRVRAFRRFMRAIACTGRGELEGADEAAGHLTLTKTQHLKETEVVMVKGSTSSRGGFNPDQEKPQSEHKQEVDKEKNKDESLLMHDVYCNEDYDTVNIKEKTSCTTQNNLSSTCQNISTSGEGDLEVEPLPETYKTDNVTSKEMGFSTMATTSCNKDLELAASIEQKEFQSCRELKQSINSTKGLNDFDEDYGLDNLFDEKISNVKSCSIKKDHEKDKTKKRKSKRRGKRQKMESGLERETEGKHEESGSISNKINNKKRNGRPNYFLSVRVDDSVIHENVKKFHEHILKEEAALRPVLISLPSLHLTLFVMRLDNETEISKAKEALQSSKKVIQECFYNCLSELNFKGLETFGNKVIYLGLDKKEENQSLACLNEAVNILCESYSDIGIELDKNAKEKFVPHVTVIKLSKNVKKMKKEGIKRINEKLLEDFHTCEFGSQKITEILLCSMLGQKEKDGFYKVIDRIPLTSEIDVSEMNEKLSDGGERRLLSDDQQGIYVPDS